MEKVIGVKFKTSGRVYFFSPLDLNIKEGDGVIVETARGVEYGDVVMGIRDADESEIIAPLKPVIRIATAEDTRMRAENAAKEGEAFAICQDRILQHNLDMKLVDVEYTFNGSKVVFYFTADERVDFRDLVKDLAFQFKTRIELRQIGVRDEAKMLGGLGSCGRPVCCKTFLDDFRPVSIKMAKEQNLSLSPTKISGLCGRLMCCLQYEQEAYESMRKNMPKVGKAVVTADGVGTVISNDVITEKTKVRLTLADGTIDVKDYHYTHIALEGQPLPEIAKPQIVVEEPTVEQVEPQPKRPVRSNQSTPQQPKAQQQQRPRPKPHKQPTIEAAEKNEVGKKAVEKDAVEKEADGAKPKPKNNDRRRNFRRRTNKPAPKQE